MGDAVEVAATDVVSVTVATFDDEGDFGDVSVSVTAIERDAVTPVELVTSYVCVPLTVGATVGDTESATVLVTRSVAEVVSSCVDVGVADTLCDSLPRSDSVCAVVFERELDRVGVDVGGGVTVMVAVCVAVCASSSHSRSD